jgi:hypothetical protein
MICFKKNVYFDSTPALSARKTEGVSRNINPDYPVSGKSGKFIRKVRTGGGDGARSGANVIKLFLAVIQGFL